MSDAFDLRKIDQELDALTARAQDLRHSRRLPGHDPAAIADAALTELELATEELSTLREELSRHSDQLIARQGAQERERRTLRSLYAELPVPALLLERDGIVRRINRSAGAVFNVAPGYATGKPFPVFVDISARAAVRTQLSAVVREGVTRSVPARLIRDGGTTEATLVLSAVDVPGEPERLVSVLIGTPELPAEGMATASPPTARRSADGSVGDVAGGVRRLDIMSGVSRALLSDDAYSEAATVRRVARLLAEQLADWVIVDLVRGDRLVRVGVESAVAADDPRTTLLERIEPDEASISQQVADSGRAQLISHAGESGVLGQVDGVCVCDLLGVRTMLAVPLRAGRDVLGVLTLVSDGQRQQYDLPDLGLLEEIGDHVGLALRSDRSSHRRAEIAAALQASLLPRRLESPPGLDIAGRHLPGGRGLEVGGDVYDAFPASGGVGLMLADVAGKGQEAAALTSTARQAVRLFSLWEPDPALVLRRANTALLATPEAARSDVDRFVTAVVAHLEWRGSVLTTTVANAGHPAALVGTPDGRVVSVGGGGVPLGLFPGLQAGTETVQLPSGSLLVLYSDGVTGAGEPGKEAFGASRLRELVVELVGNTAEEAVSRITSRVLDWCGGELRDDLALLAVRVLRVPDPPYRPPTALAPED